MTELKPKARTAIGNDSVRCLNCGQEQAVAFPCAIPVFVAISEAFDKLHEHCEPSEAGKARFVYKNVQEWRHSWDTGVSAMTIHNVLMQIRGGNNGIPHDPSDFGRCYRLLKVAPPEWRTSLGKVTERYPAWAPFVERWDELEALYDEELPTGKAPKLFALMQELRGS